MLNNLTLIILFFLSFLDASSQDYEGVWLSSYELRIGTFERIAEFVDEGALPFMKDLFSEDSVYTDRIRIIHFDSASIWIYSDIRSNPHEAILNPWDHKIRHLRDTFNIRSISALEIELRNFWVDSVWYEYHFEKVPNSNFEKSDSTFFENYNGSLKLTVQDSVKVEYQLDLIDDRRLVITGNKNGQQFTCKGTWHKKWIGGVLFFAFYDDFLGEYRLFHFYEKSNDGLLGNHLRSNYDLKKIQEFLSINIKQVSLPPPIELEMARTNLFGNWTAKNEPLFYDPAIEFGFLSYQSFELELDSAGAFSMRKSGSVLKFGDSIPLEEITEGNWNLSKTGNYIELELDDGSKEYLSIVESTQDKLDVTYYMKTLSEFPSYNVYENRLVELRK